MYMLKKQKNQKANLPYLISGMEQRTIASRSKPIIINRGKFCDYSKGTVSVKNDNITSKFDNSAKFRTGITGERHGHDTLIVQE